MFFLVIFEDLNKFGSFEILAEECRGISDWGERHGSFKVVGNKDCDDGTEVKCEASWHDIKISKAYVNSQ